MKTTTQQDKTPMHSAGFYPMHNGRPSMIIFFALFMAFMLLLASCDLEPTTKRSRSRSHRHYEKWYQEKWCKNAGGRREYRLRDGTRIDCLTTTHAIEFDFAPKWAESIGQALYYGQMTGKTPGIVLIMEHPAKDQKYLRRLRRATEGLDVTIWTMTGTGKGQGRGPKDERAYELVEEILKQIL